MSILLTNINKENDMFASKLLTIGVALSLAACGSDSTNPLDKENTLPDINQSNVSIDSLKQATHATLEMHIKNGLYRQSIETPVTYAEEADAVAISVPADEFSTTITQEQNVDEGDRVKYDGKFIYIANNNQNYYTIESNSLPANQNGDTIKILQRTDQGDITKISETVIHNDSSSIDSIYLSGKTLAVFSNIYNFTPYDALIWDGNEIYARTEQKFNVSLVDVNNANSPSVTLSYTIDGSLLNSRRVGNTLYIVSSYVPYIEGLAYAESEDEKKANYNKIINTNITALLPTYENTSGEINPLINTSNCYLPQATTEKDGFLGLVTLTTINVEQPTAIESTCINAQVSGLYATTHSLYLYGTQYSQSNEADVIEQSIIHKFSIDSDSVDYVASQHLQGNFSWHNPSLRFSEQDEYLRVVTSEGNRSSGYNHKLNILKETANGLELIAQLPNESNPTVIGKLNADGITQEEIKAVRFFENKAYIVTFLNTDPLYVVDLTNNEQPYIAGALEIPGYSSYLHPISNDLLVGIGQNIDINRLTGTNNASSTPIIEGAKVSLFDISNIAAPVEVTSIVYPGGYSPVEFDYHALTYLKVDDNIHRFALPIERWNTLETINSETNEIYTLWKPENFLALLEVSNNNSTPSLSEVGQINPFQSDDQNNHLYRSSWNDRSIIHENDVYYIHGNNVWKSYWLNPLLITGPF
jgi:uncharacterized secreted protein with C-terminal beta-propeller domain